MLALAGEHDFVPVEGSLHLLDCRAWRREGGIDVSMNGRINKTTEEQVNG